MSEKTSNFIKKTDIILHPVRMRILQNLATRNLTPLQLAEELVNVPQATLYRHLNKLVEENKDSSVVFIAPAPENEAQIKKFLKKYSFEYNITPSSTDFIASMNIENFPTHLVVDKNGIIRQVFIGYADDIKEKLKSEIDKLTVNGDK